MFLDGTIQLWATLLGWHSYNVVLGLLSYSGLAMLPVVGMLIQHIVNIRMRQSLTKTDADSLLAPIESQLIVTMMVILLTVIPVISIGSGNVSYTPQASVYNEAPATQTIGSSGTNLDSSLTNSAFDITGGSVKVPLLWYLTMQLSNGMRHALVNTFDDGDKVYRALRDLANRAGVKDAGLRQRIDDFHTECYTKALSMYRADGGGGAGAGVVEGADIGWIGSKLFQDDYYGSFRTSEPKPGFPHNSAVDTAYPGLSYGAPTCQEYWEEIRTKINAQATAEGALDLLTRAQTRLASIADFGIGGANYENEIARLYMNNTELRVSPTADQINSIRSSGDGWFSTAARQVSGVFQSYQLAQMAAMTEMGVDAIIYALQFSLYISLMVLYMFAPLVVVLSRYSLPAVMTMLITCFLLNMMPAVWAMIAWFDNRIGVALWNNQSLFGTLIDGGPDALTNRFMHSIAIGLAYVSSTGLMFWYMAMSGISGAHIISGVGRSLPGMGGGVTPASGMTGASTLRPSPGGGAYSSAASRAITGTASQGMRAGRAVGRMVRQ